LRRLENAGYESKLFRSLEFGDCEDLCDKARVAASLIPTGRSMNISPLNRFSLVLLVFGLLHAPPALTMETLQMIRDAVTHYDQGEFESAVTLLEQVLDLEPDNGLAAYELALTHQANRDLRSCITVAKRSLRRIKKDPDQAYHLPQLSMLQASCHSESGDTRRALKVFHTALKRTPDDYGLNFNIAITLLRNDEGEKAIQHLEAAIVAKPSHPSPYYILGIAYQAQNQSVLSVFANLTFLQHEFNTPRTNAAARAIIDVAYSGIAPDASGSGMTMIVDSLSSSGPPDITILSLALTTSAAASTQDGQVKEPAESIAELLQGFISTVTEVDLKSDQDSFFVSYLLRDIFAVEEAGVTLPFSYFVASTAGVEGASGWLDQHPEETDELAAYFEMLAIVESATDE